MKVSLIQCPNWTIHEPPMASACLSAYLKKNGHEVTCFDFGIELFNKTEPEEQQVFEMGGRFDEFFTAERLKRYTGEWADRVLETGVKAIGFTLYETTMVASLLLAQVDW